MRILILLAGAMGLFGQSIESLSSAAQPITRLYVFGDSYSDTGAGYLDGNGPTAIAYLAGRLGLPLALPSAPMRTLKASTLR